ncbi:MAG TPA: hypothetical protein VNO55_22230 [Polyangia bacterium]|nr:hypothetical protein [Polyangia bacterium]
MNRLPAVRLTPTRAFRSGGSALLLCLWSAGVVGCSPEAAPPGSGTGSGGSSASGSGGSSASGSGGSGSSSGSGGDSGSGGASAGSGGDSGSGGAIAGSGGRTGNTDGGGSGGARPPGDGGGSSDAPTAGAGCADLKATFCEDFDKQTTGQKPTGMFTVTGSVVVDSTRAFSGKQALHIMLPNPKPDTAAQLKFQGAPLFPALAGDIFARAMVYMTAVPGCCSTSNGIHWDLSTAKSGGTEYTLGSMYGNFMPVYQPGDDSVDTKTKWPEGKWACIQWEFKGTANYLDVKVDGMRAAPGIPVTKWKATTWSSIDIGWINFQQSSIPVDMWIDDLAFGSQEIPCPAAPAP